MTDERLRQPDVGDELGDRGLALGQAADDAQPVHVGQGLVEGAQLAQVLGLDDDRRRSSSGSGRAVGTAGDGLLGGGVASTTVYINRALMLSAAGGCQGRMRAEPPGANRRGRSRSSAPVVLAGVALMGAGTPSHVP